MEQYGLTSDALSQLAFWVSTQHWTPAVSRRDITFVDCIPLRTGRIVIATAREVTMQLPLAVMRADHPQTFGRIDDGWLLDGCVYQPLLQELLDAATGHAGVPNLLGTGAQRLSAAGATAAGVPLGSSVCDVVAADSTWRVRIPRVLASEPQPLTDADPPFARLEGLWDANGVTRRSTLLTAHHEVDSLLPQSV